jgi:hypothetical protein
MSAESVRENRVPRRFGSAGHRAVFDTAQILSIEIMGLLMSQSNKVARGSVVVKALCYKPEGRGVRYPMR